MLSPYIGVRFCPMWLGPLDASRLSCTFRRLGLIYRIPLIRLHCNKTLIASVSDVTLDCPIPRKDSHVVNMICRRLNYERIQS
jgi:hypothetical protein